MCASVVAGCDAAPVLDPAEDILDFVALAVRSLSLSIWTLRLERGGMCDAEFGQSSPEPVAVVALTPVSSLALGSTKGSRKAPL